MKDLQNFVSIEPHFESWRGKARELLQGGVRPDEILWKSKDDHQMGFEQDFQPSKTSYRALNVSYAFIEKASFVACARVEHRWSLLYRLLFRLVHENSRLLENAIDPDVAEFLLLEKSVRRDIHKMHAFVRFKKRVVNDEEIYVAWHQPEHIIVRKTASFFMKRFGDKKWSIFTPDESAHWDMKVISYSEGVLQNDFEHQGRGRDPFDEVWKSYYKSIFNPARIKIKAMKAEFPEKYWASLPEAEIIRELVRDAPSRLQEMAKNQNLRAEPPSNASLSEVKSAASVCNACPLAGHATQTVFGEGPKSARMMIVGEQPGDEEDTSGQPFVGPSGHLLNEVLSQLGMKREEIYITNAVKHFKYEQNGKLRLHKTASGREMHACKPWLEKEIELVKPEIILVLGRTAATSVLGRLTNISKERGQIMENFASAPKIVVSWHPSAILRSANEGEQQEKLNQFVADLRLAQEAISA